MTLRDQILEILETAALTPPSRIAAQLGVSEEEVRSVISELERERIILAYKAMVDGERLGRSEVQAVIEVKISPEREGGFDRVATRIARFDEVSSCFLMSGGYDLLVRVQGRDLKSIARFISEKLSTIPGVLSTSSHFMLKTYKASGVMFVGEEESDRLKVSP